jgi:hypothetical protein
MDVKQSVRQKQKGSRQKMAMRRALTAASALRRSGVFADSRHALATLTYLPKLHASIPANLTKIHDLVNEYEVRRLLSWLVLQRVGQGECDMDGVG